MSLSCCAAQGRSSPNICRPEFPSHFRSCHFTLFPVFVQRYLASSQNSPHDTKDSTASYKRKIRAWKSLHASQRWWVFLKSPTLLVWALFPLSFPPILRLSDAAALITEVAHLSPAVNRKWIIQKLVLVDCNSWWSPCDEQRFNQRIRHEILSCSHINEKLSAELENSLRARLHVLDLCR